MSLFEKPSATVEIEGCHSIDKANKNAQAWIGAAFILWIPLNRCLAEELPMKRTLELILFRTVILCSVIPVAVACENTH